MKKTISAIMSLVMTAALFTQTMPVMANTVDTPVDIDKSMYDQIIKFNDSDDTNGDGVISEEEFKNIDYIRIDLNDIEDISGLKKAEKLRTINFEGGSITDFSVLRELKNLRIVEIRNNPIKDISCFKDMNLNFLYLDETNVSDEDKISMIQTRDYEIPVGFVENFDLKPSGMIKTTLVINDNEIAGFGDEGEASKEEGFYNDIIAKKVGETTYSVLYNDQVIFTGKIKVVPSEVKNPVSDISGLKVIKSGTMYRNDKPALWVLTDDKKYYELKNDKLVLAADHVKTAYINYINTSGMDDGTYILKDDSSFTINGEQVFDDSVKVSEISGNYALTSDGALWFINVTDDGIEKTKISKDCAKLINRRMVSKKDGTVFLVNCQVQKNKFYKSNIYEIGKMNVVSVYNLDNYVLDDEGNVWNLNIRNYYTAPDVKLAAKKAVKLGGVVINGSFTGPVYATADGKVYYCNDGEELTTVTIDDIVERPDYDYYTIYGGLYEKKDIYTFREGMTVAGVEICNDDRIYGRNVLYHDKSLYMTCLGRHMAVADVKESYGAYYDQEENDYSVFILRNDGSLWEYRIGADTLTQVTTDSVKTEDPKVTEPPVTTTKAPETTTKAPVTTTKASETTTKAPVTTTKASETTTKAPVTTTKAPETTTKAPVTTTNTTTTQPEEKLSVSDVISLIRYMTGTSTLTDSQDKKYDMNSDGKINVVDIILMKNMILEEKNK